MLIKKTFRSADGFSLMELMMVMVILPIVSFALYSNFSSGVRVWTKVVGGAPDEDLNIFFTKTSRDLAGMLRFDSIPFNGEKDELSFAGAIDAPAALGGPRGIGQIRLYYDADARTLRRELKDYSQIYRGSSGTSSVLLQHVSSFEFSYFTSDPLQSQLVWVERWKPEPHKLPVAVKMSFSVDGTPGQQVETVFIPAGGLIK